MDRDGYSIKQICIDEWIAEQAAEWKLIPTGAEEEAENRR